MANKQLFKSGKGRLLPQAKTQNQAGGIAYAFGPKHALAQFAATGTLSATFYASAESQLEQLIGFADQVSPEFLAKTAIYMRQQGFMKDSPALLVALLSTKDARLTRLVFPRVIDNAKMLRNFVQILRSGVLGRKSLGTMPKALVRGFLDAKSDLALFRDSVGNDPSLADVIKMVHPKPTSPARSALYGYLLNKPHDASLLPAEVQAFETFKADPQGASEVPDVPFQMLTALPLGKREWQAIARRAGWQMTRMNLNTFLRHGVFEDSELAHTVAKRLGNPRLVAQARVFPYQLLMAYKAAGAELPAVVREALQDAMEHATQSVPTFAQRVVVLPDVSGSMRSPVTGYRKGATSAATCVDVAALIASVVLRNHKTARVLPFEHRVVDIQLNPRDSVMTNAQKLASVGGGGTSLSAPLEKLNRERATADLVIYVSDNESWVDNKRHGATEMLRQWEQFKLRSPAAKLVCIDLLPYGTTQAMDRDDILNVGGFSDQVFKVIRSFALGNLGAEHWVGEIEKVSLELN
ncbi:MAG: RNA-binding protein [Polyangiaceae bacterium]